METRTIVQGKIYVLWLNPIFSNAETREPVAAASNLQLLESWYYSQKCEPYRDDRWFKYFKQGSTLEMFNPLREFAVGSNCFGHGVNETWVTLSQNGQVDLNILYLG